MKNRRFPVSSDRRFNLHQRGADYGTQERWGHASRVFEPTQEAGMFAARVLEEHILDRLALAGFISSVQKDAGFRFKRDYHAAGMNARLTGGYTPTRGSFSVYSGWDERSDIEEEAYGRWRRSMKFLRGRLGDVVVSVVCYEEIPSAENARLLRSGLKVLTQIYGLGGELSEDVD
ncbi:MAG TPA: hypothetical protein DD400_05545 [Rhodospirillaceae bacterium]|nr:hypothetical protein [Rhodospirillaceae bacterium]